MLWVQDENCCVTAHDVLVSMETGENWREPYDYVISGRHW